MRVLRKTVYDLGDDGNLYVCSSGLGNVALLTSGDDDLVLRLTPRHLPELRKAVRLLEFVEYEAKSKPMEKNG